MGLIKDTATENEVVDFNDLEEILLESVHMDIEAKAEDDKEIVNRNLNDLKKKEIEVVVHINSCDQCDYKTKDKSNMKKHIRAVHDKEKIPCCSCDKKFYDQSALKKHKESIHEGVKYDCGQCNFYTTSKHYLKKHVQVTHEGHNYKCQMCEFRSVSRGYLKKHVKS